MHWPRNLHKVQSVNSYTSLRAMPALALCGTNINMSVTDFDAIKKFVLDKADRYGAGRS